MAVTLVAVLLHNPLCFADNDLQLLPYTGLIEIDQPKELHKVLGERTAITLGVSRENFEPYEVIQGHHLKGIVADYLSIIGKKLGVAIKVVSYPDRASVIQALMAGEIDVFGNAATDSPPPTGLALSAPYMLDYPVLVGRGVELGFSKIIPQGEIAFEQGAISAEQLRQHFPNATPVPYASTLAALHAVEYKKYPWYVGAPATVSFYLAQGELSHLHSYPLKNWPKIGYSFLLRSDDAALRAAFDAVINGLSTPRREQILNYWSNVSGLGGAETPPYTSEEEAWLATQPNVRVAINGALPPYSFYDDNGEIRGVVLDLLAEISQNTGINFTIVDYPNLSGLEDSLRNKRADMALTLLPNPEREKYLKFTEPYLYNSFALVTNLKSDISSLDELSHQKVAIQRSNFVEGKISGSHPDIELVKTDSHLDSLISIANGENDAAVTLLPTATYLIRQYFPEDLKVATSLPDFQANLPFSVRRDEPLLYSVMLKALDQLKPGYINGLMNTWKGAPPAKKSVWRAYISYYETLCIALAAAIALILFFLLYVALKRNRAMREAERFEFRSTLLDSIPMAISVRDLDGRFVFCNQVFYAQLRTTPDQVIGRLTSEFMGLPRNEAQEQERLYFRTLQRGIEDQRQLDATVNGMAVTLRQWDKPFTDKSGNIAGLISGYADVTSNVLLLQKLREARDSAVQANEAKSRFLAVMSHEIRTPLNAVIGLLELTIERINLGGTCNRDDLEVAYSSSKSLIELIDDILDLAKIESGKISLMAQRCNLSTITRSVIRIFSGVAQQKNIYLEFRNSCTSLADVSLDAGRFKQVLSNLLSNAIKFTDRGGVTVSLSCNRLPHAIQVSLLVADTGIGISAEDQADLFKPFSQARSSQHSRGGTGLGLVICRQLIEMMGGKLELQSTPNQGTQVTIEISVPELEPQQTAATEPDAVSRTARPRLNVLLVDDHPANRLLLGQQLQFLGHGVEEAEDGAQALAVLHEKQFDLVITDCSMPVMDGYQLTREWRAHERQQQLAPCWIYGFTANAQPEEKVRCLEAGMDGCLFKPVSLAELEACLNDLHPRTAQSPHPIQPVESDAPLFDSASIEGITGGNRELMHMLVTQLHTSNALDLEQLKLKIRDKQWKDLGALAHRLKGVARLINSVALQSATNAYEQSLAEQHGEDQLTQHANTIKSTLEKLQQSLAEQIHTAQHFKINT